MTVRAQETVVFGIGFALKPCEAEEAAHIVELSIRDLHNRVVKDFHNHSRHAYLALSSCEAIEGTHSPPMLIANATFLIAKHAE